MRYVRCRWTVGRDLVNVFSSVLHFMVCQFFIFYWIKLLWGKNWCCVGNTLIYKTVNHVILFWDSCGCLNPQYCFYHIPLLNICCPAINLCTDHCCTHIWLSPTQHFNVMSACLPVVHWHIVISSPIIKGRDVVRKDPSISVDYDITDPLVRYDSYENLNVNHEDSLGGKLTICVI